jgi:hypothetical protein
VDSRSVNSINQISEREDFLFVTFSSLTSPSFAVWRMALAVGCTVMSLAFLEIGSKYF